METTKQIPTITRLLVSVLLLNVGFFNIDAQTIHFSQAYASHLTLNPANTGRFNGDWRLSVMHRQQGYALSNEFRTDYLAFELPVYIGQQKIDFGLFYGHDNSSSNTLPVERANLSIAHGVRLTYHLRMHVGIQGAFVYKHLGSDGLTFPDQYNRETGGFDPTVPTSDVLEQWNASYPDFGWGVLLSWDTGSSVVSGGYSTQQLNRPVETFLGQTNELPFRHVGHVKADVDLNDRFFAIPSFIIILQKQTSGTLLGGNVGYKLNEWQAGKNSVIAGCHFRNVSGQSSRSLIFSVGYNWQYWSLIGSYDTDVSKQRVSKTYGNAIEFGLVFKMPSTELTHQVIPCERY